MDQASAESPGPQADPERRPRPEARALRWEELLDTVQDSMRKLIHWLEAALDSAGPQGQTPSEASARASREQLATSVLIAGDRGFGKTTLLLTLAEALERPEHFLTRQKEPRSPAAPRSPWDKTGRAEDHPLFGPLKRLGKRLVLLTPLDMEPMQTEANLLATLLVRVRAALNLAPYGRERERLASPVLLEEGLDEPWGKIDQLVRDATFMWEDIPVQGQDPRQRAEYQLRAAELYANFQSRFYEAIESVCRHLARREFGYDTQHDVILVLPIDNVDRSIQHLHLILKLTRMVASRRLWFVLASGRQEFQLFLERTFQKELTESGKLIAGPDAHDQTRSIARRQAAAAMRRVLPEPHRIEIRSLRPEETWGFQAPASLMGEHHGEQRLHELLEWIPLPGKPPDGTAPAGPAWDALEPGERRRQSFAALFDLNLWVSPDGARAVPCFTDAGRQALTISARTALDLWQAAHTASARQGAASARQPEAGEERDGSAPEAEDFDGPAIDIARRMLLVSIDESDLPGWASEQLLHRIIRRDREKRTLLDLTGTPIQRQKRTALADVLDSPLADSREGDAPHPDMGVLRTELHLRHFQDIVLELHDLDQPGRTVPLPPNVAGWFMLLHDLLILTEERRVVNLRVTPLDLAIELVVTQHEAKLQPLVRHEGRPQPHLLAELNLWWIPPEWETFIDFAIFTHQWGRCFVQPMGSFLRRVPGEHPDRDFRDDRLRLILAAWVDNVCSVAGPRRGGWRPKLDASVDPADSIQKGHFARQVHEYEEKVAERVEKLYLHSLEDSLRYGRSRIAWRWLMYSLPLMLNPEFMPARITRHLRALLQTNPHPLPWNHELLRQRRFEVVRAVLQRSEACERYGKLLSGDSGPGAAPSGGLLLEACLAWLESVPEPAAGEEDLPPRGAGPGEEVMH